MLQGKLKYLIPAFFLLIIGSSCEELIQIDRPKTQLVREAVFEDDLTATAAISVLYSGLTSQSGFASVTYLASLSADEMIIEQENDQLQFYTNEILPVNTNINTLWTEQYSAIYKANSIIEGLQQSTKITAVLKNQLLGEAIFFRAFHHFYLVNLFGEVPYITSTNYRVNSIVTRRAVSEVYEKIITDLIEAKTLLAEDYSFTSGTRVRVNKFAAAALLARAYLYLGDWVHAEEQATTVISKTSLYDLTEQLSQVFLKNSVETIWQLIPPNLQKYTTEGGIFIRPTYSVEAPAISGGLINAFESADVRKSQWIGTGTNGANTKYYPYKYKEDFNTGTGAEYSTVFRLAEQYLIRAEARAQLNKLTGADGAKADINKLRTRAGLLNTTAVTQQEVLAAIAHERRTELFTEWGHRWFDLKRTSQATSVLQPIKPDWQDTDVLYPIPFSEIQLNTNLKPQNDGY